MLKIGEFSRLSQISIKALHIYDERGLLRPEHVDTFTSYRYYSFEQLPRAHHIMALKGMGLSLEQIGLIINQEMNIDELRGMFRLKKAELEQQVREEQQRLAMVEFHLKMIEVEDNMPELNVIVKEIPSFAALYLRFRPVEHQIPTTAQEINELIAVGKIKHTGQFMGAVYGEKINPDNYEFAFIVPVTDEQSGDVELSTNDKLVLTQIPPVLAATIVVRGHGEADLFEKQVLLERWAIENGYGLCHEYRAIHHKGAMHHVPQSEWVTELQIIVEERS
ncbi:MAG: MerR family transcriptional regulator [Chloroflexi bacterium]|nr:MAG: MerR family transcriptional regulator [Chloroflexota bacterium]